MCDRKTYYKLPMNIQALRNMWGETLEELAHAVGVGLTAISNYERGERIPERDVLILIAKHYRITENELIHGDFSSLPKMTKINSSPIELRQFVFDRFLPIVSSLDAMQNVHFREAFHLHEELSSKFVSGNAIYSTSDIEKCIDLYDKAIEDNVIEARANRLWWIIFLGAVINLMTTDLIAFAEVNDVNKCDIKKVMKSLLPSFAEKPSAEDKELIEVRKEFYETNIVDLLVNIRFLKLSQMYADLGDYYMAISYLFGLTPDTISPEMKSSMGFEMLMMFDTMGNFYAKRMLGLKS